VRDASRTPPPPWSLHTDPAAQPVTCERELFIDNLLVRIHFIIVMIRWTGLAPWEFEFPFPGSLISTFLESFTCALSVVMRPMANPPFPSGGWPYSYMHLREFIDYKTSMITD